MAVVTIVMGSKSDYETVLPAYEILRKLGVDSEKTAERQELEHSFGVTEQKLDDRAREAQDELADNYRELGEL